MAMSTSGWLRPTIGRTSLPNRPRLRACFIEYPLATKIIVRRAIILDCARRASTQPVMFAPLSQEDLSYSTNENCLQEEFSNFGQIAEVKLVKDKTTKKSKGYAFVQYTNQDDAMSALESMDDKYLDGRVISVELAKPVKDRQSAYPKTSGPPQEPFQREKTQTINQQNN